MLKIIETTFIDRDIVCISIIDTETGEVFNGSLEREQ